MRRFGKVSLTTVLAVAISLCLAGSVQAATARVYLDRADPFAILSGAGVTDAGGASVIAAGNVGATPITGAAIGLLSSQLTTGTIYAVDGFGPVGSVNDPALLTGAWNDLTTAYNDAAGRTPTTTYVAGDNQLGGLTLTPGVYRFGGATTANLIGTLTLDANGDPNPVWIFQATSTLVTAGGSSVVFLNTGTPCDVFWQVSSSATIGATSTMVGNIMADQSIAMLNGATLDGSAQARIGSVTLINNTITKGPCALSPAPTPTPTPVLPNTGLVYGEKSITTNLMLLAGAVALLFAGAVYGVIARKKKQTD